jgi:hypothetical protein
MKYTNWTPDFDSLYSVDSVKYLRGRIQIYQAGNVDSTEVLTVDTTQVLNLQQFVEKRFLYVQVSLAVAQLCGNHFQRNIRHHRLDDSLKVFVRK